MWKIVISGSEVDENEARGVMEERYTTWREGRAAWIGVVRDPSVVAFGPYVQCECTVRGGTCEGCDLQNDGRAFVADVADVGRIVPGVPLSFSWEYGRFVAELVPAEES